MKLVNEKDTEKALRSIRLSAPARLDERVNALLDRIGDPLLAGSDGTEQDFRRRARLSRAFAAAAGLVGLGLVLAWWLSSGSDPMASAYAELATAVSNSRNSQWAHVHGTMQGEEYEVWVSLHPYRRLERRGGHIKCDDSVIGRGYSYDPDKRVLTVGYLSEDAGPPSTAQDFLSLEMERLEKGQESGRIIVTKTEEVKEGKAYAVYTVVEVNGDQGQIIVDTAARRIVRVIIQPAARPDAPERGASVLEFDYPETGPADIYAFGVPQDARIVDQVQSGRDLAELWENVNAARDSFAPTYFALIYQGDESSFGGYNLRDLTVVYKKNGRCRVEKYDRPMEEMRTLEAQRRLRELLPPEDMAALETWVRSRQPSEVYIGSVGSPFERSEGWHISWDADGRRRQERYQGLLLMYMVEGNVWGLALGSAENTSLLPPRDGSWGRLIGAAQRYPTARMRRYYNPSRDYVLEETEWMRVAEYAQTPQGQWYAKKIVGKPTDDEGISPPPDIVIHLDTTREIPDSLFDLESFDRY